MHGESGHWRKVCMDGVGMRKACMGDWALEKGVYGWSVHEKSVHGESGHWRRVCME